MAKTFKLKLLTLDKIVYDSDVAKVFIEADNGKLEVLPNYAPSIISMVPCITTIIDIDGHERKLFTSDGIVNVKNNVMNICCDAAEFEEDIDFARAKASKERAEKRLSKVDKYDLNRIKQSLIRSELRIKLSEQSK